MTCDTDDHVFTIKQGDTAPAVAEKLYNDDLVVPFDNPIDLTGCTVRFHLRPELSDVHTVDQPADIVVLNPAQVRYEWQAGDTSEAGDYLREWEITLPGGDIVTVPNDRIGYPTHVTPEIA